MTPVAALLARIGWTTGELAGRLDISPDTAGQWARGRRGTPLNVLTWLAEIAGAVDSVAPLPVGWADLRTEAD